MRVLLVAVVLTAVPPATRADDRPWAVGLALAADAPAGGVAALVVRPGVPWARLHGGVTWNYYAFGLQGGLTLAPLRAAGVTPTLTVEAGTTFDADLRSPLSGLSLPPALRSSLASAGYSYGAGMLGLELGNPEGTVFFVRGGLARAWSTLRGLDRYSEGSQTTTTSPVQLAAWMPAASLGVALRFW